MIRFSSIRKLLQIALSILFVISLAGCSNNDSITNQPHPSEPMVASQKSSKADVSPTASSEPTASHAPVDYDNGIYRFFNEVTDEEALKIIEQSSKRVGEDINIPVYYEEELLLGRFNSMESGHLCPAPGINYSHIHFANNGIRRTSGILTAFPNGAWRDIGNANKYLMYDTEKGTRYYVFFNKDNEYLSTGGYPLLSCKKLAYSDMRTLNKGQTIDDVIAIDPTANYTKILYDPLTDVSIKNNVRYHDQPITTVHLLTDGIMKITYERRGTQGNYVYTITDIEYHSDFKMESIIGDVYGTLLKEEIDYRIANEDYVD